MEAKEVVEDLQQSFTSEKKETKVEDEEKISRREDVFLRENDNSGYSNEDGIEYFALGSPDGGPRNMSTHRRRSLITTLRDIKKGSRNTNTVSSKDWGFLASKSKKRFISCSPHPSCSCFTSSGVEKFDDIRATKRDEGFQELIDSTAKNLVQLHAWQTVDGTKVDVVENYGKPKELELYLWKQQLTLYDEKVKPRYIVDLVDMESVSYLKPIFPQTEPMDDSQTPFALKGIVLKVRERGSLQIMCNSRSMLEKLAVALRTNELLIDALTVQPSPRDHPIGAEERRISATLFKDNARSGDIVLFKTDSLSGKVIRKVTSGNWDHIAIVFNFASGKCGILESLQNTGVAAYLWEDLIESKAYLEYKKVAIRPLIVPRDKKKHFIHKIEKFIYEASKSGLNYGLGATKLMRRKSVIASTWDENRTYFCSELVAKCLKGVRLLRPNPASCQYRPCDFSEASSIELLNGCYFDQEVEIGFEEVPIE